MKHTTQPQAFLRPVITFFAIVILILASCAKPTIEDGTPATVGEVIGITPGGSAIMRIETENEIVFIYPGYGIAATAKCKVE